MARPGSGDWQYAEQKRVAENSTDAAPWHRWGPYLSERQWGTVREDYSAMGTAWDYFPHDEARSRAYRWGEDGILGISDCKQILCFSVAMWNRKDAILKERLFGLTNSQGNHGEDVKECYYFLDNTPSHSYMKGLYKYPQAAYPYERLIEENARRGQHEREFELTDTGVFDDERYFDILVEYAKQTPDDIHIRISVTNRGPERAELSLIPQIWFRNRWSWNTGHKECSMRLADPSHITIEDRTLGTFTLYAEAAPEIIFTENDTDNQRVFGSPNASPYVKDAFHRYVVNGELDAVNPAKTGTKAGCLYDLQLESGETRVLHLRLSKAKGDSGLTPAQIDELISARIKEADEFYEALTPGLIPAVANIQRQAFAGMLWSKQYYHYDVRAWHQGDALQPPPPPGREDGRNAAWNHFDAADVLSMPDTWEYPWFASWDLAFHCIPLALVDPKFAKNQLTLLLREWYMHPNGQIPAYEWAFGDVNPPVHAWAAWRVYTIERRATGKGDRLFLERVFHKLLLNFTWWVNRKDAEGNNVFEGGFLGLDNIGIFDRNQPLPSGDQVEQSDGTSWMGMFCLSMLTIALELAQDNRVYEDVATKFLEHFLYIAEAMNNMGPRDISLWDEEDGFYYDLLFHVGQPSKYVKVRSMVGLIPIFAVTTLEPDTLAKFPGFKKRLQWFLEHRPECVDNVAKLTEKGKGQRQVLSLVSKDKLVRIMERMLSEDEFLSPYGLRALSKVYKDHPYQLQLDGTTYRIDYEPAESTTGIFGGNSNWRGPVWFPLNYLMIESLQNLEFYYGRDVMVEMPTGSGISMSLAEVAAELEVRLVSLFLPYTDGRPCLQGAGPYDRDAWKDLVLFNEYFDGDTGRGLGASHQTGWTGLIAKVIQQVFYTAADRGDTASVMVTEMKKKAPKSRKKPMKKV